MLAYYNINQIYSICSQRCAYVRRCAVWLLLVLWMPLGSTTEQEASDTERRQESTAFVQTLVSEGILFLKEGDAKNYSADSLYEALGEKLIEYMDITYTSRLVIGSKYWNQATKTQRDRFIEQFWKLLVRTYVTSLTRYLDASIEMLPPILKGRGRVYVPVNVSLAGQAPSKIIYRIHPKDGRLQAYDLSINGISLVKSFRASWREVLKKEGIDKLTAYIAQKN